MRGAKVDYIVSGGGAHNRTLVKRLEQRLAGLGCTIHNSDEYNLPVEAKEAAAFALLAWQSWHRLPANMPGATGAHHAAILGRVTYAPF
jgi:anhydro-N-acetylmuramic acid kinase